VFGADLPSAEWPAEQPAEESAVAGAAGKETLSLKDIARHAARAAERDVMERVLTQTGWNRVRAAKLLSISYRALLYKIKDVGLDQKRTPS
jgi:DNA-binding NtrC family response regulator